MLFGKQTKSKKMSERDVYVLGDKRHTFTINMTMINEGHFTGVYLSSSLSAWAKNS